MSNCTRKDIDARKAAGESGEESGAGVGRLANQIGRAHV